MQKPVECPLGMKIQITGDKGLETKILSSEIDTTSFSKVALASPVIQELMAQDKSTIDLSVLSKAQYLVLTNLADQLDKPKELKQQIEGYYASPYVLVRIVQAAIDLKMQLLKDIALSVLAKKLSGQEDIKITEKMMEKEQILDPLLEFMSWFSTAKYSKEIKAALRGSLIESYNQIVGWISSRVFAFDGNQDARALVFKNNAQQDLIASNGNGNLAVWNFKTGSKLKEMREQGVIYSSLALGDNQNLLVGASATDLQLIETKNFNVQRKIQTQAIINGVAVHPFAQEGVATQFGDAVYFDAKTNQQKDLATQPATIFRGAAFASSGKLYAIAGDDKKLRLFSNDSKKEEFSFGEKLFSVAFNQKNDYQLIIGGETVIYLLDLNKRTYQTSEKIGARLNSVAFSSDGKKFVAGNESKIFVGHVNSKIEIKHTISIPGVNAVLFSPDNRMIVAATQQGIRVVDLFAFENGYIDTETLIYLGVIEQVASNANAQKPFSLMIPNDIKISMRAKLPPFLHNYLENPLLFTAARSKQAKNEEAVEKEVSEFEKIDLPLSEKKQSEEPTTWWQTIRQKVGY